MGSLGSPKTWVPYMNTKDCSQGFCSVYCPQWCYIIFPPPPPLTFPDDKSGLNFSPLVIAVIGILASAFLLVSYYAIISKFCGNMGSSRRGENHDPNAELEENRDNQSDHDQSHVGSNGLDEALIKSITVFKYAKRDRLIEGTECSVCLSEFEEDESLRLLPKCSHAFHVPCIDMWLKSHSNCPLCRANIVFINASSSPSPPAITETLRNHESNNEDTETEQDHREIENVEERDTIIEIRDNDNDDFEEDQQIRRSVSMGYLCQRRILISDVLQMNLEDDLEIEEVVGSSKRDKNRVLHCVMSPVLMKRSFSSGRFSFSNRGRGRKIAVPV